MNKLPDNAKIEARWNVFGSPTTPGTYQCAALGGRVYVTQRDVDNARNLGGNPLVRLCNAPAGRDADNFWTILVFTGEATQILN